MFLLPHLFGILEREPLAEDLVVFGSDPVRVDLATGEIKEYPPLVPFDAALERVISNVAMDHHRPFSFEAPFVDVQLAPHLRFHGQGFDVVSRPAIFIRVHRVLGATIDEMVEAGSMSAGLGYFLKDGRAGGAAAGGVHRRPGVGQDDAAARRAARLSGDDPDGHGRDRLRAGHGRPRSPLDPGDAGPAAGHVEVEGHHDRPS